jgi:hypothetical protein
LKHGGILAVLGPAPGNPKGELTATLASAYSLRGDIAPIAQLEPTRPPARTVIERVEWDGVPILDGIHRYEFSYVANYGTVENAAAIHGRIFGPAAANYLIERAQATIRWRLTCEYARVDKKQASQ